MNERMERLAVLCSGILGGVGGDCETVGRGEGGVVIGFCCE